MTLSHAFFHQNFGRHFTLFSASTSHCFFGSAGKKGFARTFPASYSGKCTQYQGSTCRHAKNRDKRLCQAPSKIVARLQGGAEAPYGNRDSHNLLTAVLTSLASRTSPNLSQQTTQHRMLVAVAIIADCQQPGP
eukprot:1150678-Pelagomonas_calceolata.AAC.3